MQVESGFSPHLSKAEVLTTIQYQVGQGLYGGVIINLVDNSQSGFTLATICRSRKTDNCQACPKQFDEVACQKPLS